MILKKYFYVIKNYKFFRKLEKKKKLVALSFWMQNVLRRCFKMIKNFKNIKKREEAFRKKLGLIA